MPPAQDASVGRTGLLVAEAVHSTRTPQLSCKARFHLLVGCSPRANGADSVSEVQRVSRIGALEDWPRSRD